MMRKLVIVAAVLAATAFHADAATTQSEKHIVKHTHRVIHRHAELRSSSRCATPADIEAEQAILFQTDVMVVSSTCRDSVYAQFRMRNASAIIGYQNEMISYFRHEGKRQPSLAFETYITDLANDASRKQNGQPTALICQQSAPLMKQASAFDAHGLHDYAIQQAKLVSSNFTKCVR
jgi:hypothetical protein